MQKEEELKAIDIQLVAIILILVSGFISFLITYNQKLNLEKKKTLFNSKQSFNLTLFNRVFGLILSFVFLYVNIKLYNISKEEGEDLKPYTLQIIASTLVIISGIITLYIISLSSTENIVDVENPLI